MNVNPAHAPEPLGQPGAHLRDMASSKSDPAQGDPVGMVATAPPLLVGGYLDVATRSALRSSARGAAAQL